MIESSTKVATAVWVGNSIGEGDIFERYYNGVQMSQLRHQIAPVIQRAANAVYGGDQFPNADSNLTRQVLSDLPERRRHDRRSGDGDAGGSGLRRHRRRGGRLRRGRRHRRGAEPRRRHGGRRHRRHDQPEQRSGRRVPDVAGERLDKALSDLRAAGFGNVQPGTCTEDATAGTQGRATGTSPAGGYGREPQRRDHGRLQPREVHLVPQRARQTALTALAAVGAVGAGAAIWGIGIERYLFTIREHEVRDPAGRAPRRSACCTSPMPTWRRGSAASRRWIAALADRWRPDLVVNTGDNLGHAEGLRGLRAALDPLRGIPGVFVHGSNDHAAPSPRNPLRYFTGPSNVKSTGEPLDTQALDGYLDRRARLARPEQRRRLARGRRAAGRRLRRQRRAPRVGSARRAPRPARRSCRRTWHRPRRPSA